LKDFLVFVYGLSRITPIARHLEQVMDVDVLLEEADRIMMDQTILYRSFEFNRNREGSS
jgi:hypothetical protein